MPFGIGHFARGKFFLNAIYSSCFILKNYAFDCRFRCLLRIGHFTRGDFFNAMFLILPIYIELCVTNDEFYLLFVNLSISYKLRSQKKHI